MSPIEVPLPPEVEASIAKFGAAFAKDDPSEADGHCLRELITKHRALPPPTLAPITEEEIAALCRRFPSSSIHIFASRLFAEAVRIVTALFDADDLDLTEEFRFWYQRGEDTDAPPAPAPEPPPPWPPVDPAAAELVRRYMSEYATRLREATDAMGERYAEIRAEVEAKFGYKIVKAVPDA